MVVAIRPTSSDRVWFRDNCASDVKAAAKAMFNRFAELGFKPPYGENDGAWEDLADFALRAARVATQDWQARAAIAIQETYRAHSEET